MFTLSVISDEISQDFQRVIDVCKEYGVGMVEPRSVWDTAPPALTDEQIACMKGILSAAGFTVPCIAAPFLKCDLGNAEQYQQHLDQTQPGRHPQCPLRCGHGLRPYYQRDYHVRRRHRGRQL